MIRDRKMSFRSLYNSKELQAHVNCISFEKLHIAISINFKPSIFQSKKTLGLNMNKRFNGLGNRHHALTY